MSKHCGNVIRATSANPKSLYKHGVHVISVTDRDRTTGCLPIDLTLLFAISDDGGEHRNGSKTTLGRYVSVKIETDGEDDRTSKDGSLRPVYT